jgi:hypothetical protein
VPAISCPAVYESSRLGDEEKATLNVVLSNRTTATVRLSSRILVCRISPEVEQPTNFEEGKDEASWLIDREFSYREAPPKAKTMV